MGDFPCLEVLALPYAGAVRQALGQRFPLTPDFLIGRSPASAMPLTLLTASERHLRIEHRHQRWWALDLGSSYGTLHNGEPLRDAELHHGDVLELPWGFVLRMLTHDPDADRNLEMQASVEQRPDDEARWQVWADWLLERGHPLGHRIREGARVAADDARFLGSLAGFFRLGWLEVDWWLGFPRRAVVRSPGSFRGGGETPALLVERLCQTPSCRFLTHLEVDVRSFGSGTRESVDLEQVLDTLVAQPGLPWLEALRLGPLLNVEVLLEHRDRYAAVQRRRPRLTTPLERVGLRNGHATLEVLSAPVDVVVRPQVGSTIGLVREASNLVGQLEECAVQVLAPEGHPASRLAVRIDDENGRWVAEDLAAQAGVHGAREAPLKVNGRELVMAHVRDGDVLEPTPGLLVRLRTR